jgi:hypothetical protein
MKRGRRLQKQLIREARSGTIGRAILRAGAVAAQPLDYWQRRQAVRRYNRDFPSDRMTQRDAYTLLPTGTLEGSAAIIEKCRNIFAVKQAAMAAENARPRNERRKSSFLKNLLADEDLTANPELVDFALSDPLFRIVTNYLGTVPTLNSVDLLYSVPRPDHDDHIASQLFHQDPEGLTQAKVFINVFDVGDADGPFMFIPAAESERIVSEIRSVRRQSGARDDARYRDDEVSAHGGLSALLRLEGPAGAGVVVDTSRCLHAGSRLMPGHSRLILFIQYVTSREKARRFDVRRYQADPVRWLALRRHAWRSS